MIGLAKNRKQRVGLADLTIPLPWSLVLFSS